MYRDKTVAVVIPAYNEEGFVGEVIDTVPDYVDRIYAVDDCSTDGTWEEINRRAGRETPDGAEAIADGSGVDERLVPIRHETNRGVGAAIKTGYLRARDEGVDVAAVMAGDGQMDPDLLDRFIEPIVQGRAEYTKGNRLLFDDHRRGMPRFRQFGSWILSFLTKISSGYWKIGDSQNGYTAISRRALERSNVEEMYESYGYCNDLLTKLNLADMRVADVPMPAKYGDEQSHITYSSYIPAVSAMLLRNFLWRLRRKHLSLDFHPVALLYPLGVSVLAASLLTLAVPLALGSVSAFFGAVGAFGLFAFGCFLLLVAMTYDLQANEHLNVTIPVEAPTDLPEVEHEHGAPAASPLQDGHVSGEYNAD